MTEELRNKLTERFEQLQNNVDCDEQVKDALLKAYLAGGEYGYQYAVKKACEWLENNAYLYVNDIDQINESALIGDFRGVMED